MVDAEGNTKSGHANGNGGLPGGHQSDNDGKNSKLAPAHADVKKNHGGRFVPVASTLAMAEGTEDNPWSYHRNSSVQAFLFNAAARPVFAEEIGKVRLETWPAPDRAGAGHGQLLFLADLGCSSGINTIANVCAVYDDVSRRYAASGSGVPPAMAFFSDLPSNDFNSLFRLLNPPESLQAGGASGPGEEQLLWNRPGLVAAGVPGTFYKKLFPSKMLHVVMAVFAVHWISQIPPAVCDRTSPAFNRGGLWLPGARGSPQVEREYARQFVRDLSGFLVLRAAEVATGGLLMLELAAKQERTRAKPDWLPPFGQVFEDAWNELVEEGKLDAADRDAFNMPMYFPTLDEVREAVEDANSRIQSSDRWEVKRLEYHGEINPFGPESLLRADPHSFASSGCNIIRSVVNSLVQEQLGPDHTDALFSRMAAIAAQRAIELIDRLHHAVIVAVLACK